MKIRILNEQDAQTVRSAFVDTFVLDWQEYQIDHQKFIKRWKIEKRHFDGMLMWDKMPIDFPTVSFREALALLRGLSCEVLLLSEGPDYTYGHRHSLRLAGQEFHYFVAAMDACTLAARIEYEWIESIRLMEESVRLMKDLCYLEDAAFPDDLYICTPEMDRMLVFTHETHDYEAELAGDYIKQAESRICIAFGFERQ